MAALPPITRISREDLKEAPEWIAKLLTPMNRFMESVYSALNKQLTIGQNVTGQIVRFSVKAGATAADCKTSFSFTLGKKPEILLIGSAVLRGSSFVAIGSAVNCEWTWDGSRTINIESVTGLSDGETYDFVGVLL